LKPSKFAKPDELNRPKSGGKKKTEGKIGRPKKKRGTSKCGSGEAQPKKKRRVQKTREKINPEEKIEE